MSLELEPGNQVLQLKAIDILNELKDKLNNLNPRNRSLRLLKINKDWNFDVSYLDKLEENTSSKVLSSLLEDITPIPLMNINLLTGLFDDIESEDNTIKQHKRYYNYLTALNRKISSIEQETGIYDLFVGYPFIECQTTEGTYLRAPLLLNPCHLERVKDPKLGWKLTTDNEFRPIFNDTLFMGLQKYNNTIIPKEFYELEQDVEENELIKWAIEYFQNNDIPVIVEDELGTNVKSFPDYKTSEIPDLPTGKIFIRPYAVLGIFPQSTSNLKPDYESMMEEPDSLDLVLELLGKKENEEKDLTEIRFEEIDKISEEDKFPLTPTDESQDRVLVAFRKGQNFVLHGPPGTGKSHVILNIIAECLARQKKILVVCQKRAALDVIYNRMDTEGLSQHLALVHDFERDKKNILQKIKDLSFKARQIAGVSSPEFAKTKLNSLASALDNNIKELNTLAELQKRKFEMGLSPYEIYCLLSKIDKSLYILIKDDHNLTYQDLTNILAPIKKLGNYYVRFEQDNYILKNRISWSKKTHTFQREIEEKLDKIKVMVTF